jgi:hypothetical protein
MARSLEEMVARWAEIAKHAATYNLTVDDWLNDLDLRDMIARQVAGVAVSDTSVRSRLESADRVFREATLEAKQSLWGPAAGAEHHPKRQWWYFRYPRLPGASMKHDLEAAGVTVQRRRRPSG